jgi:hypothetical protein
MQQQHWFSETSLLKQPASRILSTILVLPHFEIFGLIYLHEKGVSIVNRVAELEGKNGIGAHCFAFFSYLVGGESVLIQTVVPPNPVQHFEFAANQPVAALVNHLRTIQIQFLMRALILVHIN